MQQPLHSAANSAFAAVSAHIREPFHGLGEVLNGLVGVAVLDAIPDTVLDVAFQHHLPALVQGRLGRVDLGKDVLAGRSSGQWPAPAR